MVFLTLSSGLPVAHYTGGVGVVGSNLAAPTIFIQENEVKPYEYNVSMAFSCLH